MKIFHLLVVCFTVMILPIYIITYFVEQQDSIKILSDSNDFHTCSSIGIFKKNITALIRPNPKTIFDIHNPQGFKCIFQIRLGWSPIKCHNFADTPNDLCECICALENMSHFLLCCPLFDLPRINHENSVTQILLR